MICITLPQCMCRHVAQVLARSASPATARRFVRAPCPGSSMPYSKLAVLLEVNPVWTLCMRMELGAQSICHGTFFGKNPGKIQRLDHCPACLSTVENRNFLHYQIFIFAQSIVIVLKKLFWIMCNIAISKTKDITGNHSWIWPDCKRIFIVL